MLKTNTALFLLLLALTGLSADSSAANDRYSWTLTLKGSNPAVYTGKIVNTIKVSSSGILKDSDPELGGLCANAKTVCCSCCGYSCCPCEYKSTQISSTINLKLSGSEALPPPRIKALWLFSQPQPHGLFVTVTRHTLRVNTYDCFSCYDSLTHGFNICEDDKGCDSCEQHACALLCCCLTPCIAVPWFCNRCYRNHSRHKEYRLTSLADSTSYNLREPVRTSHLSIDGARGIDNTSYLSLPLETHAIHLEGNDRHTQMWLRQVIGGSIFAHSRVAFPGFLHAPVRVLLQVTESQQNNSDFTITMRVNEDNDIRDIRMEVSKLESGAGAGAGVESGRVTYQIEQLTFESPNIEFTLNRSTGSEHAHTEQPTPGTPPLNLIREPSSDHVLLPDANQIYNPQDIAPPPYTVHPDGNSGLPPGK